MSNIFPREPLTAIAWTFGSVAIALTAGRYYIRYRYTGNFRADDYLHGVATVLMIVYLAVYTWIFGFVYEMAEVGYDGFYRYHEYIRSQLVVVAIFFAVMYTVKLAFLALFYELFSVSAAFRKAWWAVLAFTILSWLMSFTSNFWWCDDPIPLYPETREEILQCFQLAMPVRLMPLWCALMVTTDVLILLIPIVMIGKLHMSRSRKIGLLAIFLLVTFNITLDILRTCFTVYQSDNGLDSLWDILEATTAVIISALPSYRLLLPKSQSRQGSKALALEVEKAAAMEKQQKLEGFESGGGGGGGGHHPEERRSSSQATGSGSDPVDRVHRISEVSLV